MAKTTTRSRSPRTKKKKRRITPEDLLRLTFVGDPRMAPDGSAVAFMHKSIGTKNEYRTNLWLAPTDGEPARAFTSGNKDRMPRFSPDGERIAFVSERDGLSQVYTMAVEGGEARVLTALPEGAIGSLEWSPDGSCLAMSFRPTMTDRTKVATESRKETGESDPPLVIDDWWYRLDGDGYFGDARHAICTIDAETGEHRVVYDKDDLGGAEFDFSPDGRFLAIATNRDRKAMIRPWKCELLRLDLRTGKTTSLPGLPAGPITAPRWSPDGKSIAFASRDGHSDWDYSTENLELWVCDARRGGGRSLTGKTDHCLMAISLSDIAEASFGPSFRWSANSRRIFMQLGWHGESHVASVRPRGGKLTFHTRGAASHRMGTLSADGKLMAFTTGHATRMPEIAFTEVSAEEFELEPLTSLNRTVLSGLELSRPRSHWIRSDDGNRIQVWVLNPVRRKSRGPAVLQIHGGPHAQYGCDLFHEFQVLAAAGYTVVYSNPRGSKGYGRDHCDAIRGSWGGADWVDIQAVTAFMRSLPSVDPKRMGVMGGSYGGYMTNWVIGHTNEFKAAITDRCVSNLHSMFGSSDYVSQLDNYWEGNAWDRPEKLWEHSPLKYFGNVRTPTLIIHSEGDLRCNVEQAEQVFVALKLRNVPTRFVRYPSSTSHGLSRGGPPDLRLHRLHQILDWLHRYLKKK